MLYNLGRFLSFVFLKLFCNFTVSGREFVPAKGGFLLATNHASNADPLVIGAACPKPLHFMAKVELFKDPFFSWVLREVHAFPVKRGTGDIHAIREAIRRVRAGGGLLIFPEGGRSQDGQIGQGHEGIGFLAEKLNVPIVPAYIRGTDKVLPRGSSRVSAARVTVSFGKQILVERRMPYQAVADRIMEEIRRLSCASN
ncbi:MAG: 1-acyl-sn-glycerol-3-phosphate acyltransferase [Candidatus Omnitrophica bacterium]|jgi:1-acyl-sn-glycerol-3-phosphate acyltransferase|nr:1-acyl-sn-glycerol-3-phosphate acyltransferase [Candidatus Omnitrophota bacterium]